MWTSNTYQSNINPLFIQETEQKQVFQPYQTPIKQNTTSKIQFDFNYYFGNLFSSGHLPVPRFESFASSSAQRRENNPFVLRSSTFEKSSFKINPGSEYKTSNLTTSNKVNEDSNTKIESTVRHIFAKKNLNEVFNNAKNENICSLNNNNKYTTKENTTDNKDLISQDFPISSPPKKVINKKLFECSGSTMFKSTSAKSSQKKKRRFRKNYEQLQKLSLFYSENKHWSKNQIKKISEETGLKENKVYKWLWDQKNKEYRNAKFIVNK